MKLSECSGFSVATSGGGGGGGGTTTTSQEIANASLSIVPSGHVAATSYKITDVDVGGKTNQFILFQPSFTGVDNKPFINASVLAVNTSNGSVTWSTAVSHDVTSGFNSGYGGSASHRYGNGQQNGVSINYFVNWSNGGMVVIASGSDAQPNGDVILCWLVTYTFNSSTNTISFTNHGKCGYHYGYQSGYFVKQATGTSSFIAHERDYSSGTTWGGYYRKMTVAQDGTVTTSRTSINSTESYSGGTIGVWDDTNSTPTGSMTSSFIYVLNSTADNPSQYIMYICQWDGTVSGPFTGNAINDQSYYWWPYYNLRYSNDSPKQAWAYQRWSGGTHSYPQQRNAPPWYGFNNPSSGPDTSNTDYYSMPSGTTWASHHDTVDEFRTIGSNYVNVSDLQANKFYELASGKHMLVTNGFNQNPTYVVAYKALWSLYSSTKDELLEERPYHLNDILSAKINEATILGLYFIYSSASAASPSYYIYWSKKSDGSIRVTSYTWPSTFV